MEGFEEQFKTRSQTAPVDLGTLRVRVVHKTPSRVPLMDPNRAKNLAITLRKAGTTPANICTAIQTYVVQASVCCHGEVAEVCCINLVSEVIWVTGNGVRELSLSDGLLG